MSEIHFDEQVDITDVVCPVTFVKAKVALEDQILKLNTNDDGTYTLFVKKVGE